MTEEIHNQYNKCFKAFAEMVKNSNLATIAFFLNLEASDLRRKSPPNIRNIEPMDTGLLADFFGILGDRLMQLATGESKA